MSDRMFYIEGEWRTYEQAHSLGYSLLPQRLLNFYTVQNERVVIKQDSGDNTYYDSENYRWVVDFADLHLYKKVKSSAFYRGESCANYNCYIASIAEEQPNYIFYNSLIRSLEDAYEHYGITSYECENIILDENSSPLVWYDSRTGKYFDDRDGFHRWVNSIGDVQVTMYDSSANLSHKIYENEEADYFYINSEFISRDNFYSHDNNGIIRESTYVFKNDVVSDIYYDSYSEEYCIPNVTNIWMSREAILALGYLFVEGVADMWRCITPLHLPWRYRPSSATLSFRNTHYSHLTPAIDLPEDIEVLIGTEVTLPEITGVYTDQSSIKWSPSRWSIGEFNSLFALNESTTADLECEKVKVTITFANPYYSSLDIPLPESITVDNGDTITLPTVTGEFIDEDHIIWNPLSWDVGQFDSSYVVRRDITANILCEKMRVTLTFTNNSHPELEITLPPPSERHYGDTVILQRMRGVYRDEDNLPWIPLEWDIGGFDQLYTIYSNMSTDLIWQPLSESMEVALCGSMPTDSGSPAEAGDYIVLTADGAMKLDLPVWPETNLTENYEIYSGQIEIWHSSYTPYHVEFGKHSYVTSDQMIGGTIRKWGVNDNEYVDFSMAAGNMCADPMRYADVPFADIPEVRGDRLKIWDSHYTPYTVEFPIKSGESTEQMYGGSIRKWGNYANSGTPMSIQLIGNMLSDPMRYADVPLTAIPEVHGDRLKVYDKDYDPIHVDFPDKPLVEPRNQMIGGTIRLKGNKANRSIDISLVFDGGINPNPPEPEPPTPPEPPEPVAPIDSFIVVSKTTGDIIHSLSYSEVETSSIDYTLMQNIPFTVIESDEMSK